MNKLEKIIKSKFVFFYGTKYDCEKEFDSLKQIENDIHGRNNGYIDLKKSKDPIYYDSLYELKVLKELDKCSFIKKIKTQSLVIPYKTKKIYIPDIQILLDDNSIVLIEIKPFKDMVNSRNIKKYKALRKYAKENGYGFTFIDQDYYSFEDLKNEVVPEKVENAFLEFASIKKEFTFKDCKSFKTKYKLNDYQICHILWRHNIILKYKQHVIYYKKNY